MTPKQHFRALNPNAQLSRTYNTFYRKDFYSIEVEIPNGRLAYGYGGRHTCPRSAWADAWKILQNEVLRKFER